MFYEWQPKTPLELAVLFVAFFVVPGSARRPPPALARLAEGQASLAVNIWGNRSASAVGRNPVVRELGPPRPDDLGRGAVGLVVELQVFAVSAPRCARLVSQGRALPESARVRTDSGR